MWGGTTGTTYHLMLESERKCQWISCTVSIPSGFSHSLIKLLEEDGKMLEDDVCTCVRAEDDSGETTRTGYTVKSNDRMCRGRKKSLLSYEAQIYVVL